jgi:hypothetical protein
MPLDMLRTKQSQGFPAQGGKTKVPGAFSQRELLPICSTQPLAILSFRLISIPSLGLPPNLVFHHIFGYLPEGVVLIDMPFDFSSGDTAVDYDERVNDLVQRFTTGDLQKQVPSFEDSGAD